MNKNIVRTQHYVQQAVVMEQWKNKDKMVGVIGKTHDGKLRKEKEKSTKNLFCEDYQYEWFRAVFPNNIKITQNIKLIFDAEHVVNTNDGEEYCKRIEDQAAPIFKEMIKSANTRNMILKNPNMIYLSYDQWKKLASYLALQLLRTPETRRNIFHMLVQETEEQYYSSLSQDAEILMKMLDNLSYMAHIGVYDKKGISNKINLPCSLFRIFKIQIQNSKLFLIYINQKNRQFILGDNPCVILPGKRGNVFILMPLTPKLIIFLSWNQQTTNWNQYIPKLQASKKMIDVELFAEYINSGEKIIYNTEINSFEEIQTMIYQARKNLNQKL